MSIAKVEVTHYNTNDSSEISVGTIGCVAYAKWDSGVYSAFVLESITQISAPSFHWVGSFVTRDEAVKFLVARLTSTSVKQEMVPKSVTAGA